MKVTKAKKSLKFLIIVLVLSIVFCIIDTVRASKYKDPLFCVTTHYLADGGTASYVGLLYSVDRKAHNGQVDQYYVNFFYFIPVKVYEE